MRSVFQALAPKTLSNKLFVTVTLCSLLTAALVVGLSIMLAIGSREKAIVTQLQLPLERMVLRLEEFEHQVTGDINFLRHEPIIEDNMGSMAGAFEALEKNEAGKARRLYIRENPHPIAERKQLLLAEDGSSYSNFHGQIQRTLTEYMDSRGYQDILLIDPKGNVFFSVTKEPDFSTNVAEGVFSESGLGDAFRAATADGNRDPVFIDFASYEPSSGQATAFVAVPVYITDFMGQERLAGAVAVQIVPKTLDVVVSVEEPENPRQTFLVEQSSGVLRTHLGLQPDQDPLSITMDLENLTTFGNQSESGGTGILGEPAFVAYKSEEFFDSNWYIVSQYNRAAALAGEFDLARDMAIFAAVASGLIALLAMFIGKKLAAPLLRVESGVNVMASGNLNTPFPMAGLTGEVANIAHSVEGFRSTLLQQSNEQKQAEAHKAADLRQQQEDLLSKTRAIIDAVVKAANEGDFSVRCDTGHEEEALRLVAEGVNTLCEKTESFFSEVEAAVDQASDGDLSTRVAGSFDGRFRDLSDALNKTFSSLEKLVSQIRTTSDHMNKNILSVSEGAQSLARRTESQAASLEEVAATMEDLTSRISTTSKDAVQSADLVVGTQKMATNGREVANSAVTAMAEIEESSSQINDIISVIDSIAFQTNLLAVNAAIEAARAGDAGNGFAVVASEVRTLAQRSAEAANDIKGLIASSSQKVKEGVKLVDATGVSLAEILGAIDSLSTTISKISEANKEQSGSVTEINATITQLDDMTQHNASMADSSANSGETLKKISKKLDDLVNAFKVGSSIQEAAPAKAVTPPASPKPVLKTSVKARPEPVKQAQPRHEPIQKALKTHQAKTKSKVVEEAKADADWEKLSKSKGTENEGADEAVFARAAGEDWSDF